MLKANNLPGVGMRTRAHIVGPLKHVAIAIWQGGEDDEIQVHRLLAVAVLGGQAVSAPVRIFGVMYDQCRRRTTLIFFV